MAGGHVDVAIGSPPVYRDYVKNGQFVCLGTFIPEGIEVEGIGRIPSFKEQGIDAEFVGMDYFAVRSSVDEHKKPFLPNSSKKYTRIPSFKIYERNGNGSVGCRRKDILKNIDEQTGAMKEYIDLVKK